jgi:hypothetical protein
MKGFVIIPCLLLAACGEGDATGPNWRDGGLHVAEVDSEVDSVAVPQTIGISDTLSVQLWASHYEPIGNPAFSHFEVVRADHRLDLTVWARVDLYIGPVPGPPMCFRVLDGDFYHEPPPFSVGDFEVVIWRPDGSTTVDTVLVTDGP